MNKILRRFCFTVALTGAALASAGTATATQLSDLTAWYTAMDPGNGKTIALFANDISYLTPDKNSVSTTYNVWPAWKAMDPNGTNGATSFSWPVNSALSDNYHLTVNMNGTAGSTLRVTVGTNTLDFEVPHIGINKYEIGQIYLPAGNSTFQLALLDGSVTVSSIELVPAAAKSVVDADIAANRARLSWMKDKPVGVFLQWGEWAQNANGTHATWPGVYQNMNWANFAQKIKNTGADYVIWSVNWDQYYVGAPIAAVDAVLAGRTTTAFGGHDYLMDVVNELRNRGIKVMFYYHNGWDQSSWWNPNYVNDLPGGNNARKENFMNRWMNIIGEISTRYGTKLDGWMFDHTNSYFPAPYKKMMEVARQGNPDRMITFNSYQAVNYTPAFTSLADYYMGEDYSGEPGNANTFETPYDIVDGRYTAGPFEGMQAFSCFTTETGGSYGGWGISRNAGVNPVIGPKKSRDWFDNVGVRAAVTKQSMAYTVQMWENGDMSPVTLDYIGSAAALAHASKVAVNDNSAAVSYTGSGWYTINNAAWSQQHFNKDYHETNVAGSAAQIAFDGTGIDLVTAKGSVYGNVDIYIDGVLQTTVNLYAPTTSFQQVAYSNTSLTPGSHVLKVVNASSTYMPIDSFNVYSALKGTIINNSDPGIVYTNFTNSPNRLFKDYGGDVHYATQNGASFEYAFSGSEIAYVSEKDPSYGNLDIYLDNVLQTSASAYGTAGNTTNQLLFRKTDLTFGSHVLKVVKTSGTYALLDYLVINPYYKITNHTNGRVLNGGGGTDGYGVSEWADVVSTNLVWEFLDQGNGYFKIKNKTDGKMLTGGGASRSAVTEWADAANTNQEWQLIDQGNGFSKIKNHASGLVLNGGGSYNGYPVTEWSNVASSNLEWKITASK